MSLEKVTPVKSAIASVGVHALALVLVSGYYYISAPKTLELTGLSGGAGNGKPISLNSFNLITKTSQQLAVAKPAVVKKSKAVVKPDPNAPKVAKSEKVEVVDAVSEQAAAVTAETGAGEGTGYGTGLGIGTGAGDFDGGVLFRKIRAYFETRLASSLRINEDQLIKVKLKLSRDGNVLSAELLEGSVEVSNLRRVLAVAKNIPLKSYWQSSHAFPGELIIPLFLTSN